MSLFKIFRGKKAELDKVSKITDGYAYYLNDKSNLYIDTVNPDGTQSRKKVIGLSQINKQITLTGGEAAWGNAAKTQVVNNPAGSEEFFLADGYTYIVSPAEENNKIYAESRIIAKNPTGEKDKNNGTLTFVCKDIPASDIVVNILRMEEDPYYGEK